MFNAVARSASAAAQRLRVRSALNPMLWLTGIATPMCLAAAYVFREHVNLLTVLVIAGLAPIAVTCLGFVYFALAKPEKLQSEDYQIRHETLQLIQAKTGSVALDPTSLTAIANPVPPMLPAPEKEGE